MSWGGDEREKMERGELEKEGGRTVEDSDWGRERKHGGGRKTVCLSREENERTSTNCPKGPLIHDLI